MIMLRRVAFKPKLPPARSCTQWTGDKPPTPRPTPVRAASGLDVACVPIVKPKPMRSRPYRMWVASLACCHCNRPGPNQCAHADQHKGTGTKTSDLTCFALCVACHHGIGSEAWYPKEERRALEALYGARTQAQAMLEGVLK